jgi:hypothetical protein
MVVPLVVLGPLMFPTLTSYLLPWCSVALHCAPSLLHPFSPFIFPGFSLVVLFLMLYNLILFVSIPPSKIPFYFLYRCVWV